MAIASSVANRATDAQSAAAAAAISSQQTPPTTSSTATKDDSQASSLYRERERRRQQLRAANIKAWSEGIQVPTSSLDSNLKKNTAFVKRVKQSLGLDAKDQLLKDLPLLNLEKYLQELVQAVPEGLTRCTTAKDCFAAVEILSAFHIRFGGDALSSPLTAALSQALAPPSRTHYANIPQDQKERDEAARVARQRPLLRVTAELALVEVVGHTRDQPGSLWLYQVVKELLATDKEHTNVPLLISILKGLSPSLLDPPADAMSNAGPASLVERTASLSLHDAVGAQQLVDAADPNSAPLVSADVRAKFRKLFETYFQTLARRVVKEHQRLQEQDRKNHEAYIRSGEIFEDRQQNYERMTKSFEKARDFCKVLSDLLGLQMPELESASKSNVVGLGVNLDSKSAFERGDEEFATDRSPWEDEDSRKFYEDLLDLGDIIPPSILAQTTGASQGSKDDAAASKLNAESAVSPDPSAAPTGKSKEPESPSILAETDATDEAMNAGPAAQLNTLFARLPDMTNRTMIDSAAVDFAFIASKPARKKLVRHLAAIPRTRLDLIPYYARLTATLNRYMPDVGSWLVAALEDEFRYFQRKRNVDLTESRAKNARFLAELAKFKVAPIHVTFHCLKVCLEDFAGPNIDILATLLETCGRFLLRTEETSAKMRSMLEMLRRKRAAANLDARQLLMLDNAYYQCNPPERKAIESKPRTPMELYIRHLIYDVLTKKTVDAVVRQMRKLHWEDPSVYAALKDAMTRAWRIKFSNIHLLAIVVYDLERHHPELAVDVIDQVLENIRIGMEHNIFKHNQRRVASICYLGELYNYRLINSGTVFEQLWSLTTFGHPNGRPLPGQVAPLDAPDDYFRIRLACALLDTCGICFDRGSLRKRLDEFLVFFNLYVLTKQQPLPMDVDFMLRETLEQLRPKLVFKADFTEAALAVDEMMAAHRHTPALANEEDEEEERRREEDLHSDVDGSDVEGGAGQRARKDLDLSSSDSSDDNDSDDGDTSDTSSGDSSDTSSSSSSEGGSSTDGEGSDDNDDDDEEDEAMLRRREEELAVRKEADDEFDRELAKMMAETGSSASASHGSSGMHASTSMASGSGVGSGGGSGLGSTRTLFASRGGAGAGGGPSYASHGKAGGTGGGGLAEIGIPIKKRSAAASTVSWAGHGGTGVGGGSGDADIGGSALRSNGGNSGAGSANIAEEEGSHMSFSLLSRKGAKQVTRDIRVPSTATIAINTRTKQLKDEAERKQLKQLVLAYERGEESADRRDLESSFRGRGFRVRGAPPSHHPPPGL
ncbi:ARM repeat-containing protein [Testicularia cyperi]|uniref:ARM repeat-containing protein n=1 Tax=Testicularia cyperi TaxID=1882483 RepID=A0A317XJP5_9BASI|nr:ARM repeat-containing protein [Testicularia cyperi]